MLPASYQVPLAVLLLVGGFLSCFVGYRIFRLVLAIYGFILGGLVATSVLAPIETSTTLAVAIGGGVVGALLLVFAYFVGVALIGAALGAAIVHLVWGQIAGDPHPGVVVGAAVAGALASLWLERVLMVVGTAFAGAWILLVGGLSVVGREAAIATSADAWLAYPLNPRPGEPWVIAAWLGLGVVGAVVQFTVAGGQKRSSRKRRR